jgi:gliding motility-associated-like protein
MSHYIKSKNTLNLKRTLLLLSFFAFILGSNSYKACHALALVNPSITVTANGVQVNASSDPATCGAGCSNSAYWLDIEVRCVNESFNGAPFNPGFYGPLTTYPFFQSGQMQKPNCVLQAYPTSLIPFGALCPGVDYQIRFRENHNSQVGAWTSAFVFTAPGVTSPLTGFLDAVNDTVCEGECTILSAGVSGGCGLAMSYLWSTGSTNAQINVCPTQDSTFTVNITEICSQFTTTESITIYVEPSPDAGTASADTNQVCEGETVDLTLVDYEDSTIQWQSASSTAGPWTDIPGATTDAFQSPPIDNNTKCFRAEVGSCGTPSYSNEVCITVNLVPVIEALDTNICDGQTIDITTTVSPAGGDYLWEIDNSVNNSLYGVSPSITTDYIVHYSLFGCESEDTSTVVVYKQPEARLIVDSVCYSDVTNFIDNSVLDNSTGDVIDTWLWSFGDGNTSTVESPGHTYSAENTYNVELIIETNNGCKDTVTAQTVVYPLPNPKFSVPSVCLNIESVFADDSDVSSANTNNNITDWLWNFDDGNTSTDSNPIHTYSTDGTFNVELSLVTNNGCTADTILPAVVHPRPVVDITADTTISCSPLCLTLSSASTINSPSTISTNTWYINGVETQSGADNSYSDCIENSSDDTDQYDVELLVESNEGCESNLLINDYLTVYHNPIANFEYTPEYLDVILPEAEFTNLSQYEDSVFWTFGTFSTSSENFVELEFPAAAGDYVVELLAITDEGCRDSIEEIITLNNEILIHVPNTFTPDGDGYNERFLPIFPDQFTPQDYELVIFNRWGEIVFESKNHLVGWNGSYGADTGIKADTGTYVWKLKFKEVRTDKRHERQGHVNLMR